jgi:hypothetical protein
MKQESLYQLLKDLAEKLDIRVSEQNFRSTGTTSARSGLCVVKGRRLFLIDKHLPVQRKNEALGECLADMAVDRVFVLPAVREYLDRFRPVARGGSDDTLKLT